jgi:hypothetical protein
LITGTYRLLTLTTQTATLSTHPTKMHRCYIVSGILLILPIIDFAVAAPVLVHEKRQAVHIPEDAITMLGKRGDDLNKLFLMFEDHFAKPEESSATRPSSTMSDADYELVDAHALPNPGPSTESSHKLPEVHAPPPMQVFPTWFHPDHADYGLMGTHPSLPNVRPSNPRPSTEFDSDHKLPVKKLPSKPEPPTEVDADHEDQVVHPPTPTPGSASSTESDHQMVDVPPSSSALSTNPDRRSMGAGSQLESLQAVSDALKGSAKEPDLGSKSLSRPSLSYQPSIKEF